MSIFSELKRRNVFRVAVAYVVISWLLIQVIGLAADSFEAPVWVMKMIITLIVIGFIPTLLFSWAFELTPEGIKRDSDVERNDATANLTANKLNVITLIAAVAVAGLVIWQQINTSKATSTGPATKTQSQNSTAEKMENTGSTEQNLINSSQDNGISNKSIAVLPFTNMANNPESEPITVGLHDDLLTHISKISALKVISRTSVLRYKNTQKPIAEIAQELGVANILEGGVQKSGNQIRINVQLIDAQTDEHIWAEIFDRELTASNIFKVQTEISEKIAAALKAQLSPEERQSIAIQATDNLEAYQAYLAGRQLMLNRNSEDLKQALALFRQATKLDANYALAYVGQADVLNLLTSYSDLSIKEMFIQVEPLLAKALTINPLLAEAHTSKAYYLLMKTQFQAAAKSFQYSLTLNPNYATTYHWYGAMQGRAFGRYDEALELLQKAAELDPLSPIIQINMAELFSSQGHYEKALLKLHKVVKFAPEFSGAFNSIGVIYASQGDFVQAIQWQKKRVELDNGNVNGKYLLAFYYLELREIEKAQEVLRTMQRQFSDHPRIRALQGLIQLAQGNTNGWVEHTTKNYQSNPTDPFVLQKHAYSTLALGQYQQANDLFSHQFTKDPDGALWINTFNINDVIMKAWSLQQLNQGQEAQVLLKQVDEFIETSPTHNIGYTRVLYESVIGNSKEAAEAYASIIENSQYTGIWITGFWIVENFPIFDQVKKQPEYIKAHKKLVDILKTQREQLAALEQQGISE